MKLLSKFMTLAAAVAVSVSLASCGGDDNDEPEVPSKVVYESVTAGYSVELSDAYYQFYDVNVVYINDKGERMMAPLTENKKFAYTIPVAKLPEKIQFAVQLTAKSPTPSIDENAKYTFKDNVSLKVTGNKSDGKSDSFNFGGVGSSVTNVGSDVPTYLAKHSTHLFGPYECSTDQFKNPK